MFSMTPESNLIASRTETLIKGDHPDLASLAPGVQARPFASAALGARNFSTGLVIIEPGAKLTYHKHTFSEAITVLEGELNFDVEGRRYQLYALDCIHVPAGTVHAALNPSRRETCIAHYAFATENATRELVDKSFSHVIRGLDDPRPGEPEHLARYFKTDKYPLAQGTRFRDLFARRFGSAGICGGYGEFSPGTGLPCHIHEYDESITIVRGEAVCEVAGRRYKVSNRDTVLIPQGLCHRFFNDSSDTMAMVWVYAGDEPERTILDVGYCLGTMTLEAGGKAA